MRTLTLINVNRGKEEKKGVKAKGEEGLLTTATLEGVIDGWTQYSSKHYSREDLTSSTSRWEEVNRGGNGIYSGV